MPSITDLECTLVKINSSNTSFMKMILPFNLVLITILDIFLIMLVLIFSFDSINLDIVAPLAGC